MGGFANQVEPTTRPRSSRSGINRGNQFQRGTEHSEGCFVVMVAAENDDLFGTKKEERNEIRLTMGRMDS